MKTALLWSITLALTTVSGLQAAAISAPIFNPATGNSYILLSQNDWSSSEAEAVSLGGHLVTINDQAEQDWVQATFGFYGSLVRSLWIGLNDQAVEGSYQWTSGQPVTFTNWNAGEPNNGLGGDDEDAVQMWYTGYCCGAEGSWNDRPTSHLFADDVPLHGVVELAAVPEPGFGPGSWAAIASALLVLRRFRRVSA